ncbi:succinylglutamate desuccinylase [Shewanella gaetbuli]
MSSVLMDSKNFLSFTLDNPLFIDDTQHFQLSDHTQVDILDTGVIVFTPLNNQQAVNKDIVLSCAVHGNETAPIEICNQLITAILEQQITVKHRVLFLIGNPPAIINKTRFVEENMNRLFSGAHSKGEGLVNQERKRAQALEQYVADFFNQGAANSQRIHYDLHTAIRPSKHEKFAIYPYRPGRSYSAEQMMFLAKCGVDTILFHHEPTTTFSYYSSEQFNADAFTVELGKVMPFGENDMTRFHDTKQMLTQLISQESVNLPQYDATQLNLYKVSRSINKQADDFEFSFAKDAPNFSRFVKGETLATENGADIKVEAEVEAIVFPNANVPIGQRTVLCLVPTQDAPVS